MLQSAIVAPRVHSPSNKRIPSGSSTQGAARAIPGASGATAARYGLAASSCAYPATPSPKALFAPEKTNIRPRSPRATQMATACAVRASILQASHGAPRRANDACRDTRAGIRDAKRVSTGSTRVKYRHLNVWCLYQGREDVVDAKVGAWQEGQAKCRDYTRPASRPESAAARFGMSNV